MFWTINVQPKWFGDTVPASPKPASAILVISGNVSENETVTIDNEVYEFVKEASEKPTNIEIVIGENPIIKALAATKLAKAIKDNSAIVDAVEVDVNDDNGVLVSYKFVGTDGNDIEVDESGTNLAWTGDNSGKLKGGVFGTPCVASGLAVCVSNVFYVCTRAGGVSAVEWKKFVLKDVDAD